MPPLWPSLRQALAALALLLLASACAQTVHVRTEPVGLRVQLDEQDLGPVGPEGASVEVPPGLAPVPYTLQDDEGRLVARGELARSEVNGWLVGTAIGSAAVCAPALCGLGLLALNPALWMPLPVGCISCSCGAALAHGTLTTGLWTVPVASAIGSLGLSPLALLGLAGGLPDEVVLHAVPPPEVGGAVSTEVLEEPKVSHLDPEREMPW